MQLYSHSNSADGRTRGRRLAGRLSVLLAAFGLGLLGAGCDSFDSGRDYGPREGSQHLPGPPQYWVRLEREKPKIQSPELLADPDTAIDKPASLADAAPIADEKTIGMTKTRPHEEIAPTTTDMLAGNFKYNRGYGEPVLPKNPSSSGPSLGPKKLATDILEADGLDSSRFDSLSRGNSRVSMFTPAGPLGDLRRQHERRERRGETYNPYAPDQGSTDSKNEEDSGELIGGPPVEPH